MTGSFTGGAVGRAVGDAGPYGSACRGGRPCPPSPGNATLCRAGPVCPAVGAVRNPPVTASPCQPPLGKGAEETGDADCHSQCAHWLRNDRKFYRGCGRAGRRGRRPLRGVQGVQWAGGQRRPPLRGIQGVQWAGDRKGRPYERVAWGAVQNRRADRGVRPYGGDKGCNGRATARVAPTKALHGVR